MKSPLNKSLDNSSVSKEKQPNRILVFLANHAKVEMEIECPNVGRLLSSIGAVCRVRVRGVQKEFVRIEVASKHCSKIIDLLDKLCYSYKIIKIKGVLPAMAAFFSRVGIIAGIALTVVALCIYPCFITRVDVNGTLNAQVKDILYAHNIYRGAFAPALDCKAVEGELIAAQGVAFASVVRRGAHIYITIKPELAADEYVGIAGEPVCAKKRAVVTRVIVNGGTAVVEYGDIVEPGDVLIDAYTLMGEEKIPVPASGEAYGKVYYEQSVHFPSRVMQKHYGGVHKQSAIAMFGAIPDTPQSPYEQYELEVSVEEYGWLLPLKIYRYTFREITVEEGDNPYDEAQMKRKAYSCALEQLSESAKILAQYYSVQTDGSGTTIKVTVEAEERIC